MDFDTAGNVPQWQCFGCDRSIRVISARVRDYCICPTCEIRHGASPAFRRELADRVTRADTARLAGLLGITPQLFTEAAKACGPDLATFRAYVAARR